MTTFNRTKNPNDETFISNGVEDLFNKINEDPLLVFDVVIVGSGYGGSIAAAELAGCSENGKPISICLLERGSEYLPGMFPSRFADLPGHIRFVTANAKLPAGSPEGLFDIRLGEDVNTILASGLGGGSLINAGVMLKPDDMVFDDRWPKNLHQGTQLKNHYSEVEKMLGASSTEHSAATTHKKKNTIALSNKPIPSKTKALESLSNSKIQPDHSFNYAPVTISFNEQHNTENVKLNACTFCGDCVTGCNHNAKESLDTNLLVKAQRNGAELFTGATVLTIHKIDDEGPWALNVAYTNKEKKEHQKKPTIIRAKRVILAAGAMGSTEILLRSKSAALQFSPLLGRKFSTNGDMMAVAYNQSPKNNDPRTNNTNHQFTVNAVADENTDPEKRFVGPTITGMIDIANKNSLKQVLLEEMAVPGPLRKLFEEMITTSNTLYCLSESDKSEHTNGLVSADPFAIDPSAIHNSSIFAMMGDDGAKGALELNDDADQFVDGAVHIKWPLLNKQPIFNQQLSILEKMASDTLGGRVIPNPSWKLLPDSLAQLIGIENGPLLTVHPLGGCAMADDITQGVVNEFGCVFDAYSKDETNGSAGKIHQGLIVLDGAIIPSALGINPALSIAAISLRAIRQLRQDWNFSLEQNQAEKKPRIRPIFRDVTISLKPKKTKLQLIERLSGDVEFKTAQGNKKKWVEITLYFDDKEIQDITRIDENSQQTKAILHLQDNSTSSLRSRVRIFDKTAFNNLNHRFKNKDRKKSHEMPDDRYSYQEKLAQICEFDAILSGKLTLFSREKSSAFSRQFRATTAWLANRGIRDVIQALFAKSYEKVPSKKNINWLSEAKTMWSRAIDAWKLASHAGEVRLLEYHLTIEKVTHSKGIFGDTIKQIVEKENRIVTGVKKISYTRRGNPWHQLTEMNLISFPNLLKGKPNILSLDLKFLARKNIPLMRLIQQQDQPTALADIASLGGYVTRLLIGIHMWSFRKPDTPLPYEPRRLPEKISGLPLPVIKEFLVDTLKDSRSTKFIVGTPVYMRLTRYPNYHSDKPPIMLIHGYSAGGNTYTHHAVDPNLAGYLWKNGRDVWVIDLRTSPGLPTASYPWKFEEAALTDIPVAIDYINKKTGNTGCDIFAHCMGSVMFSMALLSNKIPKKQIRRIALSQVGPVVELSPINILRGYLASYLIHFLPTANYTFRPDRDQPLTGQLLDRLLATLPYPKEEFDKENPLFPPWKRKPFVTARHRMDALYGRDFSVNNIDDSVLEYIDDLFGPLSIETVTQVTHFAQWKTITNRQGQNKYVSKQTLEKYWQYPTFYVHGEKNGLSDISSLRRMEKTFFDANIQLETFQMDDHGHQDCIIGRKAIEVFDKVNEFFNQEIVERKNIGTYPSNRSPKIKYLVKTPWLGPIIEQWKYEENNNNYRLRLRAWSAPNLTGSAICVLVPVKKMDGKFHFVRDQFGKPLHKLADLFDSSNEQGCVMDFDSELFDPNKAVDGVLVMFVYHENPSFDTHTFDTGYEYINDLTSLQKNESLRFISSLEAFDPEQMINKLDNVSAGKPDIKQFKEKLEDKLRIIFNLCQNALPAVEKTLNKRSALALSSALIELKPPTSKPSRKPSKEPSSSVANSTGSSNQDSSNALRLEKLRFAIASCQYPPGILDSKIAYASYQRLDQRLSSTHNGEHIGFMLLMGDQVYVDATAGLFDPKNIYERYTKPYHRLLSSEPIKSIFRKIPTYSILDDHEINENWSPIENSGSMENMEKNLKNENMLKEGKRAHDIYFGSEIKNLNKPNLWYSFEENNFPFYMMDTRTRRKGRTVKTIPTDTIIDDGQWQSLKDWLLKYNHLNIPKFIVSPAILLPRHFQVVNKKSSAAALQSDSWDGYPKSLHQLLAFIASENIKNIVFLSGDEHISCVARAELKSNAGTSSTVIHSIHSSALYAPYPFANTQPENLVLDETFIFDIEDDFFHCSVTTKMAAEGDGYAILNVDKVGESWNIFCEFDRDDKSSGQLTEINFTLDGSLF